jgi:hypothetical protein
MDNYFKLYTSSIINHHKNLPEEQHAAIITKVVDCIGQLHLEEKLQVVSIDITPSRDLVIELRDPGMV